MSIQDAKEVLAWVALIASVTLLIGALRAGLSRRPYDHPTAMLVALSGTAVFVASALGIAVLYIVQHAAS